MLLHKWLIKNRLEHLNSKIEWCCEDYASFQSLLCLFELCLQFRVAYDLACLLNLLKQLVQPPEGSDYRSLVDVWGDLTDLLEFGSLAPLVGNLHDVWSEFLHVLILVQVYLWFDHYRGYFLSYLLKLLEWIVELIVLDRLYLTSYISEDKAGTKSSNLERI